MGDRNDHKWGHINQETVRRMTKTEEKKIELDALIVEATAPVLELVSQVIRRHSKILCEGFLEEMEKRHDHTKGLYAAACDENQKLRDEIRALQQPADTGDGRG